MADASADCPAEPMDSEQLLYILYTSGTTAKPKGIMHTTGGYLTQVAFTHKYVFDLKPDTDVYWCAADIGWVTGHSYIVYGPLTNGATSVMYEGTPDTPRPEEREGDRAAWKKDRLWDIIERYGVTQLYTAPTAIRTFMKWGPEWPAGRDLSTLRVLGTVGEPINPEAWMWYHEHIGAESCPIVDTWWQTETGGNMITPLPGVTTTKPGSATQTIPGVFAEVVDDDGNVVTEGGGYLTLTRPWPGMLRGIWGDPERYRETYWSTYEGRYFAGDGARVDEDGYLWILGRVDDVMNVSGHRISTAEVESALVDHEAVAEAAVVGATDDVTGQAIVGYVILVGSAEASDELREEIRPARGEEARPHRPSEGRVPRADCRRPVPARSCAACCATSPTAATWATPRPSPIPASFPAIAEGTADNDEVETRRSHGSSRQLDLQHRSTDRRPDRRARSRRCHLRCHPSPALSRGRGVQGQGLDRLLHACVDDSVIAHGRALAASVSPAVCLVILTARIDDIRDATIGWLTTNNIRHDWLIRRPSPGCAQHRVESRPTRAAAGGWCGDPTVR